MGETTVPDRLVDPRARVPAADPADRVVELARVGGVAEPGGFVFGQAIGRDHPVQHPEKPVTVLELGVVAELLWHTARNLSRHFVASKSERLDGVTAYTQAVPKLWDDTIEAHRRAVRDATLDTTAALVAAHGLSAVTMSQVAEETGIGRATLYKYFSDVETILVAWHERQVAGHLQYLAEVRERAGEPGERLAAVLETYALIHHEAHGSDLAALLHRGEHVARAQQHLRDFLRDLLAEAAEAGDVRSRHASEWIDEAVADGRLAEEDADAFRKRLRNGEDPTFVRRLRRSKTARHRGDTRG